MKYIKIHKASVHNLKNISVDIPRNKITVITGPSGSGKSSLAFDTLYAEGQRRYIESLSSYARQFLGQMAPPDVESISGLSPAIAIDQKTSSRNPRSTVGTVTEIYDYMRILFAKLGKGHCPDCHVPVMGQTKTEILNQIMSFKEGSKIQICAPIVKDQKGEHRELLTKFQTQGYSKIYLNNEFKMIDDNLKITKNNRNSIDLVIDRILLKKESESRLFEAIEFALKIAAGHTRIICDDKNYFFSEKNFCPSCQKNFPDLEPRLFSFNSPIGSCEECHGLGETKKFDKENLILNSSLSIEEGAIPSLLRYSFFYQMFLSVCKEEKIKLNIPLEKIPSKQIDLLFFGSDKIYTYNFESDNSVFKFKKEFPGFISWLTKKYHETNSEKTKADLELLMEIKECSVCEGKKLKPFPLATLIGGKNIYDIGNFSIDHLEKFFKSLKFQSKNDQIISNKLLKEINDRIVFLLDVGLNYITLNRKANTLSGGENQRIRLATQIGSALSGVLYVLDEPSIGLHQRDNEKLIQTLKNLRDLGNSVVVVEHDEETMMNADYIIDMGPGAGEFGGEIIAQGTPSEFMKKNSITAKFLSKKEKIEIPKKRRNLKEALTIVKATGNNLKNLSVKIPLGGMVCITGVSGSGKSTLVHKIIAKQIAHYLKTKQAKNMKGFESIKSQIVLDQSPIGRTPKSNPATYTGVFDPIRKLFASTNESKIRGYSAGRFSFNVKDGRCDKCEGNGQIKIEMHFLPDVYITCDECMGKKYNQETLAILYRGYSIFDILEMSVDESVTFFENHPSINRILKTLQSVGLGYIKLGQPATTLSGGEAQRMKLANELAKTTKGHTLYILDEPTTGLHFQDIKILLKAINDLIDKGNSAIIIEHNLDIIKTADWIIDMGPEGGENGGEIVAEGVPEVVAQNKKSFTGKFLHRLIM